MFLSKVRTLRVYKQREGRVEPIIGRNSEIYAQSPDDKKKYFLKK